MDGLLLAIDTAGGRCSADVYDRNAGVTLTAVEPLIGRGHAERLMAVVDEALDRSDATYGDLSGVAVTVGPGSFTGLRVGVAAARGLALALSIPAVGVSTLETLAEPWLFGENPVLSVIDAKRGEIYVALQAADATLLGGPAVLPPQALDSFLAEARAPRRVDVVGSGASIALAILRERIGEVLDTSGECAIVAVAAIGARRLSALDGSQSLARSMLPRPLYLRGADAKPPSGGGVARLLP